MPRGRPPGLGSCSQTFTTGLGGPGGVRAPLRAQGLGMIRTLAGATAVAHMDRGSDCGCWSSRFALRHHSAQQQRGAGQRKGRNEEGKKAKGAHFAKLRGMAASSSRWGQLCSPRITRKGETEAESVACPLTFAERARFWPIERSGQSNTSANGVNRRLAVLGFFRMSQRTNRAQRSLTGATHEFRGDP